MDAMDLTAASGSPRRTCAVPVEDRPTTTVAGGAVATLAAGWRRTTTLSRPSPVMGRSEASTPATLPIRSCWIDVNLYRLFDSDQMIRYPQRCSSPCTAEPSDGDRTRERHASWSRPLKWSRRWHVRVMRPLLGCPIPI